MTPRFLFGPVSADYAREHLQPFREAGACLAFGSEPGLDVAADPHEPWPNLAARLPAGWVPDFIALYLPYTSIPAGLWQAPVPLIGLAADWNLLWHDYRRLLPSCEWVFTDEAGVAALHSEGIAHASYGRLYGCGESYAQATPPETFRDIDLLFVGNLHQAIQAERLPWLERLAQLGPQVRVEIRTGPRGEEYRRLLRRARLVFNRSVRGELNQRVAEAVSCGALLLQEAGNAEVARVLPADAYSAYREDDLEPVVASLLADEADRRRRVRLAQESLPRLSFAAGWAEMQEQILQRLPELLARVPRRPAPPPACLGAALATVDPALVAAEAALVAAEAALAHLDGAAAVAPAHQALALLWALDQPGQDPLWRPTAFDALRVAWEQAAWRHPGDPAAEQAAKRSLLAWRLHERLGAATGELKHLYEAALRRPEAPSTSGLLGQRLAQEGLQAFAVEHLRAAQQKLPFDPELARGYAETLHSLGDVGRLAALGERRAKLVAAAPGLVPWEKWFVPAKPSGQELASIIILCCGQAELTQRCVETLVRHTRAPYELIFVDNGSTDGTADYLESLQGIPGPARVVVLRNAENRGFAAGCNQGLAAAQGDFLALLNNDTQATSEWLERLIALSLGSWPDIGLVGPTSNYVPAPQLVDWVDGDLPHLDAYAAARRERFHRQALRVERLSGFCLLLRRAVYERIGGLDESFGLGFFEDDDYCVRAREAGFGLAVALDVFIYHQGSQTIQGLHLDADARLQENFAKFRAKWGPERTAGYHAPGASSTAARVDAPTAPEADLPHVAAAPSEPLLPGVSACLIMKDEEANAEACLEGLAGLFDEIVVVDTGSSDRTKEIAAGLGARVFDYPWEDSFAAARNESLRHARHEWIFWMDADDRIDDENRQELAALFRELPRDDQVAYSMKCVCLPDPVAQATTVVDHVRLFRNDPRIRWRYRVHEQILPAVRALGGAVRFVPVRIRHVGYQDPALRRRKLARDLRLLNLELAEQPEDPFVRFNLGSIHLELGQVAEALPHLEKSLARSHVADSIVRKLYVMLAQGYRLLGLWRAALPILQEGRSHYPDDPELLFQEGVLQQALGNWPGAERAFRALLNAGAPQNGYFASVDAGLAGHLARHNLAVALKEQGRLSEAEAEWRAVLAEQTDYLPARIGLAETFLGLGRWDDFAAEVAAAERLGAEVPAAELRLRGQFARREFRSAKAELEAWIARSPAELRPRELYSHAWLQEGLDWSAAEQALRAVLELKPDHAEARRNLSVLKRQQERG